MPEGQPPSSNGKRFVVLCEISHGAIVGGENGRVWFVGSPSLVNSALLGNWKSESLRRVRAQPDQLIGGRYAYHEDELMAVAPEVVETPYGKYSLLCGFSPRTMTWAISGAPEKINEGGGVNLESHQIRKHRPTKD